MESRATRRIRGRDSGARPGRGDKRSGDRVAPNFLLILLVSIAIHALAVAAVVYFPKSTHRAERVDLISVTMTSLPGPAGGGGISREPVVPRKKPEKVPPHEKEPVRIASRTAPKRPPERKEETAPPRPQAPQGPGQGPAGGGKKGATIGPVTLEGGVDFSPFTWYITALQKKVEDRWEPPALWTKTDIKTVIFFHIDRSGRITDADIEQSSGMVLYDQKAVLAVKKASPLPPLPAGYKGDRLGVHYTFIPQE